MFIARGVSLVAVGVSTALAQTTADRAKSAFFRNQVDSAFALFGSATRESPDNAGLHAWLAEAALRAGKQLDAATAADDALRLEPCNAQALLVRASLFMPRFALAGQANDDSTWTYLNRSVSCDSTDGNTWTDVWKYAIMRRDFMMESRALRAFIDSGFLTAPQLTYAEWVLESLPPRAVLVTGGDLDTYSPLAVQAVRSVRPDVAVINAVMLSATWYSRPILERHQLRYDSRAVGDSGVRGPQRILAWLRRESLSGALDRPVVFALTAPRDTAPGAGVLQLAGPYWIVMPAESQRTDATKIALSLREAGRLDWRGAATSRSDRSPLRRLYEPHPALIAARVPILELRNTTRNESLARQRAQWIRSFLTRAGIDRAAIGRVVEELRIASAP